MRHWKPCLAILLLTAVAAGCGKAPPPNSTDPAIPVERGAVAEPACPAEQVPPGPPTTATKPGAAMPDDFVTAWVLRCRSDVRDRPGQGKWIFQIAERADTPASELVVELRKASDPLTADACTMELVIPPYFLLVDSAGRTIHPAVPTDPCGKPRREALAQLEKLPFRTISETPVNQVESPQAQESGCSDTWKDLVTIEAESAKPAAERPAFSVPFGSLRVCLYDQITADQTPVGRLSGARQLDGDPAKNLLAALDKAGPAASCSATHTRFAVLTSPTREGGYAVVEVDGCHRLLRPDNTLGQLDEATITLLAS